jgi:hypothetical protein
MFTIEMLMNPTKYVSGWQADTVTLEQERSHIAIEMSSGT